MVSTNVIPQLSHVGIYVRDLALMELFYRSVMSMYVTDRGRGKNFKRDIVFMTGSSAQHHQLVLASGREPGAPSTVFQMSFMVQSLGQLREVKAKALAYGAKDMNPMNHGNAWSVYFFDPEDNYVEVYMDTPFHVPQPYGNPLDLSISDEQILRETEMVCRQDAGFKMREDYVSFVARILDNPPT